MGDSCVKGLPEETEAKPKSTSHRIQRSQHANHFGSARRSFVVQRQWLDLENPNSVLIAGQSGASRAPGHCDKKITIEPHIICSRQHIVAGVSAPVPPCLARWMNFTVVEADPLEAFFCYQESTSLQSKVDCACPVAVSPFLPTI